MKEQMETPDRIQRCRDDDSVRVDHPPLSSERIIARKPALTFDSSVRDLEQHGAQGLWQITLKRSACQVFERLIVLELRDVVDGGSRNVQ